MAYTYQIMHLDKTPHNLKYKYGANFTPTEITYHQTSNNAPAINERNYLNNRTDNVYIGFHIVVDNQTAIECLPLNVQTWHAGDGYGSGNMKSIGVAMAYSTSSDLSLRNAAIENGAKVIANLMKTYNIPLTKVFPHQARSGKHCPHDIIDRYGNENFRTLIQKEYYNLTGNSTELGDETETSSGTFKVGQTVEVYEEIPGYATSKALVSTTKVKIGTYKIYKIATGARQELNISKTGTAAGAWVSASYVHATSSGLIALDAVLVTQTINGYATSNSTSVAVHLAAGDYVVYKVNDGALHEVNISKSISTPGSWVDADKLTLISSGLIQAGDKVTVINTINGYTTSIDATPSNTLDAGTYYIYKYVEGAAHEINISKLVNSPGAWVDVTDVILS